MTQALTRICFGGDAVLIAPNTVAGFDPGITLRPRGPEQPFIRSWRMEDGHNGPELVLDIGVVPAPRGAA